MALNITNSRTESAPKAKKADRATLRHLPSDPLFHRIKERIEEYAQCKWVYENLRSYLKGSIQVCRNPDVATDLKLVAVTLRQVHETDTPITTLLELFDVQA